MAGQIFGLSDKTCREAAPRRIFHLRIAFPIALVAESLLARDTAEARGRLFSQHSPAGETLGHGIRTALPNLLAQFHPNLCRNG
jgi:hypothetical protein